MSFTDDQLPGFGAPVGTARIERVVLEADDGGRFRAAHAVPDSAPDALPGVVLLPDGRGLHPHYELLAQRLAIVGVETLGIDLYGRTAGTGDRPDDYATGTHSAQLRWAAVQLDLAAAFARLRGAEPDRPVVTVGFCLGGRVALLAATRRRLRPAGAVAFYPQTTGPARSDLPAPDTLVDALTCPVLTLFGGDDQLIPDAAVATWRADLARGPVQHEVVVYPGLPHSFFDRRAAEFPVECGDAARRVMVLLRSVSASGP